MLTVTGLSKAFGPQVLFQDCAFQLQRGDRIGLIGPNGAGKTTLFSILLGKEEADTGQIEWQRGSQTGFLPQESAPAGEETILQLASSVTEEIATIYAELRRHPDVDDPVHQDLLGRFAEEDGFQIEPKAKKILQGLGFSENDFDRPARTYSGGWIMRAHLARLLVGEPDLLMLDEPTNHLDLETLFWVQDHLRQYSGSLLIISHDRAFLNALVNGILEISSHRMYRYPGNYDEYLALREARIAQQWAAYDNQQKEIQHVQTFINRFGAKATKAKQAQSRVKYLEKMERLEPPEPPADTLSFSFPQPARGGQRVISLNQVTQAYGDKVIYRDLNLSLERGQKIVVVGPNGAGKSTLLKILAGLLPLRSGERQLGHEVTVGYFAQQRAEQLNLQNSVLEEAGLGVTGVTETSLRTLLGCFLFKKDAVEKPVRVLSGGEKSRLALIKILLHPPNLLLLDEPTTHLDIASIDALSAALQAFTGTIVMVSHDVHFIRQVADRVLHVHDGKIQTYPGGYDYFLEKSRQTNQRTALVASLSAEPIATAPRSAPRNPDPAESPRDRRRRQAEERKAKTRQRSETEKEIRHLEKKVFTLEEEQKKITGELENPENYERPEYVRKLADDLEEIVANLQKTTSRWEKAVEELDQLNRE